MQTTGQIIFNQQFNDRPRNTQGKLMYDAKQEQKKQGAIDKVENKLKLDNIVKQSENPILKVGSFVPLPAILSIYRDRVAITYRELFASDQIRLIDIKDLSEINVNTTPFFASLVMIKFPNEKIEISYLKNHKALQAKRILMGLIDAIKRDVDVTKLDEEDIEKIEKIGLVGEG